MQRTELEEWVEFADGQRFHDHKKIKQRLYEENQAIDALFDEPIYMTVYSPNIQTFDLLTKIIKTNRDKD